MVSPPEVTQYPWGKGVTQRRRFYGEGAPDFYSYQCAYFGMAGSTRFELTVDEIADRAEADKWAAKAAETAAKISRSSVSKWAGAFLDRLRPEYQLRSLKFSEREDSHDSFVFFGPGIRSDMGGQFSGLFQVHAYHVSKHGQECGGASGARGLHLQRPAPPLHAPDRKGC
jgi:hypothetical protein